MVWVYFIDINSGYCCFRCATKGVMLDWWVRMDSGVSKDQPHDVVDGSDADIAGNNGETSNIGGLRKH